MHRQGHAGRGADGAYLLESEDEAEVVEINPSVLLGHRDPHEAELSERLEHHLGEKSLFVRLNRYRRELLAGVIASGFLKHPFFFGEWIFHHSSFAGAARRGQPSVSLRNQLLNEKMR